VGCSQEVHGRQLRDEQIIAGIRVYEHTLTGPPVPFASVARLSA